MRSREQEQEHMAGCHARRRCTLISCAGGAVQHGGHHRLLEWVVWGPGDARLRECSADGRHQRGTVVE